MLINYAPPTPPKWGGGGGTFDRILWHTPWQPQDNNMACHLYFVEELLMNFIITSPFVLMRLSIAPGAKVEEGWNFVAPESHLWEHISLPSFLVVGWSNVLYSHVSSNCLLIVGVDYGDQRHLSVLWWLKFHHPGPCCIPEIIIQTNFTRIH